MEVVIGIPQSLRTGLLRKGREAFKLMVTCYRSFFEEKYSTEESGKILKVLNELQNGDDFKRYIISHKRINELLRLREEKGKFTNLDDLIPIMGTKVLDKFYSSMLEKRGLGLGNPMVPAPSPEQIVAIKRVLSLNINANYVSWSVLRKVSTNSIMLDALEVRAFEIVTKPHFLEVLTHMSSLAEEFPSCDLFVCEEYPTLVPSSYMFSFILQMTQARSMLLGALASKHGASKVLAIKTPAVAKMFNTYIGFEKVSGQHVVDNMFETSGWLEMSSKLRYHYLDADPQTKEHLSNVFLINLAYWKLTNQLPA